MAWKRNTRLSEGVSEIVRFPTEENQWGAENVEEGIEESLATAPSSATGITYVSQAGNDTYDGTTWKTAAKTIPAAIEKLERSSPENIRSGVVQLGFGTFTVASARREGTVKIEKACEYVEDVSKTGSSADVESILVNPTFSGAFEMFEIKEYFEGTITEVKAKEWSKAVSASGKKYWKLTGQTTTSEAALGAWIVKPAIKLPPGVALLGLGQMSGLTARLSESYPTRIKDTGSGITIMGESAGSGQANESTQSLTVEKLSLGGNNTALYGFAAENAFDVRLAQMTVQSYQHWGINLCADAASNAELERITASKNGTANGTISGQTKLLGGGIRTDQTFPVIAGKNLLCYENYGCGMETGGAHLLSCAFSHNNGQEYTAGKFVNESGVGLVVVGSGVPSELTGGWMEGNQFTNSVSNGCTYTGVRFQATGGGNTAKVGVEVKQGGAVLISCRFQKHTECAVKEVAKEPIVWMGCECQGSETTFIKRLTAAGNIGIAAASGMGRLGFTTAGPTFVTGPMTATALALTSGTTWQNNLEGDVRLTVPITYPAEAGCTVEVKQGLTSPGTLIGTTEKNGGKELMQLYVPARSYLTLTLVKATLGTATAQTV